MVLVSARLDLHALGCAETDYVKACVAKPMKAAELEAAVTRFLQSLDEEGTNSPAVNLRKSAESTPSS